MIFIVIVFRFMVLVKKGYNFSSASLLFSAPISLPSPFVCLSTWLLNAVHQTSFEELRD